MGKARTLLFEGFFKEGTKVFVGSKYHDGDCFTVLRSGRTFDYDNPDAGTEDVYILGNTDNLRSHSLIPMSCVFATYEEAHENHEIIKE